MAENKNIRTNFTNHLIIVFIHLKSKYNLLLFKLILFFKKELHYSMIAHHYPKAKIQSKLVKNS